MPDYRQIAAQAARKYGVPVGLFLAQIQQESGFNPNARSPAGAQGIAQIVPRWHPGVNPNDPVASLNYAAQHMGNLHRQYGNWQDPLSVYNSGRPWARGQGIAETRNYVQRILAAQGTQAVAQGAERVGGIANALATAPGRQAPIRSPQVQEGIPPNLVQRLLSYVNAEDQRLAAGKPSDDREFESLVDLLSRVRPLQAQIPEPDPQTGQLRQPGPVQGDKATPVAPGYYSPVGQTRGRRLGGPHQGTHTLGNWQSDRAVDIGVPVGTPLYATFGGTVGERIGALNSSNPRMAGLRLTVDGDNDSAYYAHLSRILVRPGDRVQPGQLLGYSGTANGVPHLHIGLRTGDPTRFFG